MNVLLKIENDLKDYKNTNKYELMYNYVKNRLDKSLNQYIDELELSFNNLMYKNDVTKVIKKLKKR